MAYKISIIIPVYNMEKYLRECIDSVINQNYISTEIIIINDGSTDDTDKIVQKYLEKYSNIKYIKQKNKGIAESRNQGLIYATGEYIMFLDSDDYLEEKALERIYKKAESTGADIIIFEYSKVYEKLEYKKYISNKLENIDDNTLYLGKFVSQKMLIDQIGGFAWNKCFKSKYIEENKLSFECDIYIEDFYPIFKQIYTCNKIAFINERLYNYRQRKTSLTNKKNMKLLKDFIYSVNNVLDYIEDNNIDLNINNIDAFRIISFNNIINMFYEINKKNKKIYKDFYSSYGEYEPKLNEVIKNKYVSKKSKLSILLWKMRVYHIFISTLKKIKTYIVLNTNLDI